VAKQKTTVIVAAILLSICIVNDLSKTFLPCNTTREVSIG
jgi:hypothetical protein